MFRTRRLNDKFEEPYCVKYGSRYKSNKTDNADGFHVKLREIHQVEAWEESADFIDTFLNLIFKENVNG